MDCLFVAEVCFVVEALGVHVQPQALMVLAYVLLLFRVSLQMIIQLRAKVCLPKAEKSADIVRHLTTILLSKFVNDKEDISSIDLAFTCAFQQMLKIVDIRLGAVILLR